MRGWAQKQAFGRWIALVGVIIGVGLFAWQLRSESLYVAFMEGLAAGTAAMVSLGVGHRFVRGGKVSKAEIPGGPSVEFEKAAEQSVDAVEKSVSDLNERVTKQMDDVNRRLFDLEREVFKA